jgi:hypothetical protein
MWTIHLSAQNLAIIPYTVKTKDYKEQESGQYSWI